MVGDAAGDLEGTGVGLSLGVGVDDTAGTAVDIGESEGACVGVSLGAGADHLVNDGVGDFADDEQGFLWAILQMADTGISMANCRLRRSMPLVLLVRVLLSRGNAMTKPVIVGEAGETGLPINWVFRSSPVLHGAVCHGRFLLHWECTRGDAHRHRTCRSNFTRGHF